MSAFAREREVAVRAAREAGAIIARYYEQRIEAREKGPDNPVTKADLEANTCIRSHVAATSARMHAFASRSAFVTGSSGPFSRTRTPLA